MDIVEDVRRRLKDNFDEKKSESAKRFFKEDIKSYGLSNSVVNKINKEIFKLIKDRSKKEIFEICEKLWESDYLEECGIACEWTYNLRENYKFDDFKLFERWIDNYVHNWANCDTFCNHSVASLVEKYPELVKEIKNNWTKSNNRWKKRASAVTFIIPARKGLFLSDIVDIANILLLDTDDMVQKGYGWMLKATSEYYPDKIYDYLKTKKETMPRTSFRYALEKLPKEWKEELIIKRINYK